MVRASFALPLVPVLALALSSTAGAVQGTAAVTPRVPVPARPAPLFRFGERMLPPIDDDTRCVELVDADGDGDLDALVADVRQPYEALAGPQDRLLRNDGLGRFEELVGGLPLAVADSLDLAVGDVDGDGHLDLVVGRGYDFWNGGGGLFLDLGTGKGAFVAAPAGMLDPDVDTCFARQVVLGDLDLDGDLDLAAVVTSSPNEEDRVYRNDGTGHLQMLPGAVPDDGEPTVGLTLADVEGDGDLDVLRANPVTDRLATNDGAGTLTDAPGRLPQRPEPSRRFLAGDVDGDGDLDLAVVATGRTGLYRNDGSGTFTDASDALPLDSDFSSSGLLVDVEGDGDLDLLLARSTTDALYTNAGDGTFTDASAELGPTALGSATLAAGDVDADGDVDLLLGQFADQNRLLLGDGSGAFADVTAASELADDEADVALAADWDGDGDPDVFVGTGSSFSDVLLRNDGDAGLTDASGGLPVETDWTAAAVLLDVDRDGDLDLLRSGYQNGGEDRLATNDGAGVFTDASSQLPGVATYAIGFAAGDVDADGDVDFASTEGLYRNDGTGTFADATADLPAEYAGLYVAAVELADLDGDGDLDLFVATGSTGETDRLYANDGHGVFADASAGLPANAGATHLARAFDAEGDGDLDLFVEIGTDPVPEHLYLNDGTGTFTDVPGRIPTLAGSAWNAVAVADLDGDGDLDLLNAGYRDGRYTQLLTNDGHGLFRLASERLPADLDLVDKTLAVTDLDGDGDLDVFLGMPNGAPHRLWRGTLRQLTAHATPRAGKPLTLELAGPPETPWQVAVALGTAKTWTPLGRLRLDPATLTLLGAGQLDPFGRAAPTWLLPADPALIGTTVYAQAVVGLPWRLTNLETLSITGL